VDKAAAAAENLFVKWFRFESKIVTENVMIFKNGRNIKYGAHQDLNMGFGFTMLSVGFAEILPFL
jgi:hypothetical protein